MKRMAFITILLSIILLQWSDNPAEPVNLFPAFKSSYLDTLAFIGDDRILYVGEEKKGNWRNNTWIMQLMDMDGNLLLGPSGRIINYHVAGLIEEIFLVETDDKNNLFIAVIEERSGLSISSGVGNPGDYRLNTGRYGLRGQVPTNGCTSAYLHVNKIDRNGNFLWSDWKITRLGNNIDAEDSFFRADGLGGFYILSEMWNRQTDNREFGLNHADRNGQLTWGAEGLIIRDTRSSIYSAVMTALDNGQGVVVIWGAKPSTTDDLFAQKYDINGQSLWNFSNVPVRTGIIGQMGDFWTVTDGDDGVIVGWWDNRPWHYKGKHMWAQRIDGSGNTMWNENGKWVASTSAPEYRWGSSWIYWDMISDKNGGAIMYWRGNEGIRMQRIDGNGMQQWDPKGVVIDSRWKFNSWWAYTFIQTTSPGKFIVSWSNVTTAWAQLYDMNGQPLWSEPFKYSAGLKYPTIELAIPYYDGGSGAYIFYGQIILGWNYWSMGWYAHHINEDGTLGAGEPIRNNMIKDRVIVFK